MQACWFGCMPKSVNVPILSLRADMNLLSDCENGLNRNIHNCHTLGTEVKWQHLKSIGDEETRETNVVKDAKEPNKSDLGISRRRVGEYNLSIRCYSFRRFVDGTNNSPHGKRTNHTCNGSQKERSSSNLVNHESGSDSNGEVHYCLSSGELFDSTLAVTLA